MDAFIDFPAPDSPEPDSPEPSLPPTLRALVDYAAALTKKPGEMTEEHLAPLRRAGFSDEAILWTAEIVGYFNYVNRIADGLGVTLEPRKDAP